MKPGSILRVARHTNRLAAIAAMYAEGLSMNVLAKFEDHAGYDGVILGHPHQAYHLEFTSGRELAPHAPADEEQLLVFYLPDGDEWQITCEAMLAAGFVEVASTNPYWDALGKTFADLDGYRVVLTSEAWTA